MLTGINNLFGIHEDALEIHAKRATLIANNLANQDTPNYKAQDLDFKAALAAIHEARSTVDHHSDTPLQVSHDGHLSSLNFQSAHDVMYRRSTQSSLDGNTVDTQIEQAQFAENSMRYMANLSVISGRVRGLIDVIKG